LSRWLEKIYEKLWGQVGGRPWTEIIRDDQRRTPLLYMLAFLALGILIGKLGRQVLVPDSAQFPVRGSLRPLLVVNHEERLAKIQRLMASFIEELLGAMNDMLDGVLDPSTIMQFMRGYGIAVSQLSGMVGQQPDLDSYKILGWISQPVMKK